MIYLMYQKTNPCGIISLILGIQALIITCIPPLAIAIAVIATILGIIGLTRKERQKGQAIAGLCCSVSALTINIGIILVSITVSGVLEAIIDEIYYRM